MSRGKRKKEVAPIKDMERPIWNIGDKVVLEFLGSKKQGIIQELKKNPQRPERWIYTVKDLLDSTIYTFVGIDKSEKFTNIITDLTMDLDK